MTTDKSRNELFDSFAAASGGRAYEQSLHRMGDGACFMARTASGKRLVIVGGDTGGFEGQAGPDGKYGGGLKPSLVCELSKANAEALRGRYGELKAAPIGKRPSFGCGDRLGPAAPAHIRACASRGVIPILAQQSVRELERTQRTAQEVMDCATWGAFQEGFSQVFGADADHLKQEKAVDGYAAAGFTMYTIDPSDFVNDAAATMPVGDLEKAYRSLREAERYDRDYAGRDFTVGVSSERQAITVRPEDLKAAAVCYGRALPRVRELYEYIRGKVGSDEFDLEVSVDETSTPTTPAAHLFIAMELKRMEVPTDSLALRFCGEFQKAVDYRGNTAEFEKQLVLHAAIAKQFGYKISVHSGSDKFAIYPLLGKVSPGAFHVKTAGTSYLEALRLVARRAPALFRSILSYAFERFAEDRASYHVTTNLSVVPKPNELADGDLEGLLSEDNARQLLHITYGSVMTVRNADGGYRFRNDVMRTLDEFEDEHYEIVAAHIGRHLELLGPAVVEG
ncbi:MAG TPA: tagaturonate epimerase family protein [Candidatus Brocadiia bacterium]|nr:tagaturonate epimerase family protein [Candidatus Brocadiia bacterium]